MLRVGDRMSVFSPRLEGYCRQTADELARKDRAFRYQRKLMDGGACESTAFGAYGYDAAGVRQTTCSPCCVMSRPSRSCSSVTRRPMVMSISLRMIRVTMAS